MISMQNTLTQRFVYRPVWMSLASLFEAKAKDQAQNLHCNNIIPQPVKLLPKTAKRTLQRNRVRLKV